MSNAYKYLKIKLVIHRNHGFGRTQVETKIETSITQKIAKF